MRFGLRHAVRHERAKSAQWVRWAVARTAPGHALEIALHQPQLTPIGSDNYSDIDSGNNKESQP